MLSRAGAKDGAVGSSNAAWAVNRARPSSVESKPLMSSTSLVSMSGKYLRRRRHRALARPADRGQYSRRALGRGRAPGTDGGAEYTRPTRALRHRAVLLDEPVRFLPSITSVTPKSGTSSIWRVVSKIMTASSHFRVPERRWPWPPLDATARASRAKLRWSDSADASKMSCSGMPASGTDAASGGGVAQPMGGDAIRILPDIPDNLSLDLFAV